MLQHLSVCPYFLLLNSIPVQCILCFVYLFTGCKSSLMGEFYLCQNKSTKFVSPLGKQENI